MLYKVNENFNYSGRLVIKPGKGHWIRSFITHFSEVVTCGPKLNGLNKAFINQRLDRVDKS